MLANCLISKPEFETRLLTKDWHFALEKTLCSFCDLSIPVQNQNQNTTTRIGSLISFYMEVSAVQCDQVKARIGLESGRHSVPITFKQV